MSDDELDRHLETILAESGTDGDAGAARVLADAFLDRDEPRNATAALDRAYGLAPDEAGLFEQRAEVLNQLTIVERGLVFRYVPAGTFEMGSVSGDQDEQPVHARRLDGYWITDVPISWAAYCDLAGWDPPPDGFPPESDAEKLERMVRFHLYEANKIRLQYCETGTERARDWHAHRPHDEWSNGNTSLDIFGPVERDDPNRPWSYDQKPMVAVSWQEADELCEKLTSDGEGDVEYRLPTEAEWEKAARGGLIGERYPWGSERPTHDRCDFDHFGEWGIRPPRTLPSNGYGLYGMSGGVWEWTRDPYDALAYHADLPPLETTDENGRVLRGGSWTDCAEAVTVSFRMSRPGGHWRNGEWGRHLSPTIGFRICRVER